MTIHILVIERNRHLLGPEHPDQCVYPEHPDDRDYTVVCPVDNGCHGWLECTLLYEVDGQSAAAGPYGCGCADDVYAQSERGEMAPAAWSDHDSFEFHGAMHNWRDGHGWTIDYGGCIVNYGDYELPLGVEGLPGGRYEVDDDWDDTSCYLNLIGPVAEVPMTCVGYADAV